MIETLLGAVDSYSSPFRFIIIDAGVLESGFLQSNGVIGVNVVLVI